MTDVFDLTQSLDTISNADRIKEFDSNGNPADFEATKEFADPTIIFKDLSDSLSSKKEKKVTDWRAAKSIKKLQMQVNAAFPNRSKASDGMIGDTAHCPGSSDHCPNIVLDGVGIVTAFDITHDPDNSCDMGVITEAIRTSKDTRIKYIIYNSRICNSSPQGSSEAWAWRPYGGSNPHSKHAHFSVLSSQAKYDDTTDWMLTTPAPSA